MISSKVETIGPDQAATMLEANRRNRTLRTHHVKTLANDIASGRWKTNGETIIVDRNGDLINGQHRLWAVIEANTPITTLVVRGVDPESFDSIDSGMKRASGDVLMFSGVKNAHVTASAARLVNFILSGATDYDGVAKMTNARVIELVKQHPGVEEAATLVANASHLKKIMPCSPVAACLYFALRTDRTRALEFLEGLSTGENLRRGDPRYALRNAFLQRHGSNKKLRNFQQLALVIKSWNAFFRGRDSFVLKYLPSEEFPIPVGVVPERRP